MKTDSGTSSDLLYHPPHGNPKIVIGWMECVDFPEWHFGGVRAKVDTGARTSALHVEELELLPHDMVRFSVVINRRRPYRLVQVRAPLIRFARVRSSTGLYSERCFVRTRVRIGHLEKEIEISLISRERMLYRMLLGRMALEKDFVVDVSRRLLLGTTKLHSKKRPSQ